jgi:hypothetical protein
MFKVEYTVEGHETVFYAGPYSSYDEALVQKDDIAGFEGVKNVSIVLEGDVGATHND